jgi:biotin transport system substrate-specific component
VSTQTLTLQRAVLPRTSVLATAGLVSAGVLLLWGGAAVSIPLGFTPVPLTLQTFALLLMAAAYGVRLGVGTFAAYLALGLASAPVFSRGREGLHILAVPTGGYLVGMLAAAALVGALAERGWDRSVRSTVAAMVLGNAVIYAFGLTWLKATLGIGFGTALHLGVTPFLPGDAIKIAAATAVLPSAWALVRRTRRS